MKKILLFAVTVVALFAAGSCQKGIEYLEGDTVVTFEVSAGDLSTKAIADASNITVLHWELYGTDIRTAQAPYGQGTIEDIDGDKHFTVELRLVADQDYNIVFWAETADGALHYDTDDLRSVKIKSYDDEYANDEERAAFFGVHNFQTENGVSVNEKVTLYRPFAQINLGATTYDTSLNLTNDGRLEVNSTEMTVYQIASSFNTLDGVGEGNPVEVTFQAAATPNGDLDKTQMLLEVQTDMYYWLGMNYLIVVGNSDAVKVDVTLNTNMGVVKQTIDNVPVRENYRTNILGDFLTTGVTFDVVIDERFQQPDENVSIDDILNPTIYKIYDPEDLAKYAYMVNNVDNTLCMQLMNDITLPQFEIAADDVNQTYVYTTTPITVTNGVPSGSNMMPLGNSVNMLIGKVDGCYNTINGLRLVSADSYTGFVGCARNHGTVIQNLTLNDAVVSGEDIVGVIAGITLDGVVIKNCHVTASSVNGKDEVGGIIGRCYTRYKENVGAAGGILPKSILENCIVDAATTVTGAWSVGGIAGMNYGGILKNCHNYAPVDASGQVGGVVGFSRDFHHYKSGWVIACSNDAEVSGDTYVASIIGRSLEDITHNESISAMVACSSTSEAVSSKNLLVDYCVYTISNYGSWGIKTQSEQKPLPSGTYTACYAFESAASITQADVDAMNAAIDAYNAGKTSDDPTYCQYKWSWTEGDYPELN